MYICGPLRIDGLTHSRVQLFNPSSAHYDQKEHFRDKYHQLFKQSIHILTSFDLLLIVSLCLSVRGSIFTRLCRDGSLTLFGEFSGQGRPWLGTLREVYQKASSSSATSNGTNQFHLVRELILQADQKIQQLMEEEEIQMMGVFKQGFDFMKWIEEPESAPKESYLAK